MNNLTISIFQNQIFLEIVKELKLFFKYKIKYYDSLDLCIEEGLKQNQLTIFFLNNTSKKDYEKITKNSFPLIIITKSKNLKKTLSNKFVDHLTMPFTAIELEKRIIALNAKYEFNKSSLISLGNYIIDKNQRIIKKNDLKLQLTEKEINFLVLFSESRNPLSRNFLLQEVWNYSSSSDTHTVETHIHRLRKKILEKFKDDNFIKNNHKGYYI